MLPFSARPRNRSGIKGPQEPRAILSQQKLHLALDFDEAEDLVETFANSVVDFLDILIIVPLPPSPGMS
jgi:hypothetical protein